MRNQFFLCDIIFSIRVNGIFKIGENIMRIAIFGGSGNMGKAIIKELINETYIEGLKVFAHRKKSTKGLLKILNKSKVKYEIINGSVSKLEDVRKAVKDTDVVINLAAVIPPLSDKSPLLAIESNEIGPKVVCEAISEIKEHQPKLIHISTIGVYGDRNYKHPFGEVGDPLMISPLDIYSLTKMRGEYTVLESDVKNWVVIRQTAMLYDDLMNKNVSDGLLFHTCFNCFLEWVTDKDAALLFRNILRRENKNELDENNFWKHVFDLGGGKENQVTGYDTFNLGFKMIGASTEQFFDPNYNATRNFHGEWFSDGQKLNDLFDYQRETIVGFWDKVGHKHWYFKFAVIVPKKILKKFVIKKLLKDANAPYYWATHNDEARTLAAYGGFDKFNAIPKKWKDFPLLVKGVTPDGDKIDYEAFRNNVIRLDHYFDIDKEYSKVDISDLKKVAEARGGKLITKEFKTGDIYSKVEWENSDGERFITRPFSVLFAGHWFNISYKEYAWDFDRLAKKDKILAQVWYDSHAKDEDKFYYFDRDFNACYKEIK